MLAEHHFATSLEPILWVNHDQSIYDSISKKSRLEFMNELLHCTYRSHSQNQSIQEEDHLANEEKTLEANKQKTVIYFNLKYALLTPSRNSDCWAT